METGLAPTPRQGATKVTRTPLIDIVRCGAIDAEVSFGEAVDYRVDTSRKEVSATIALRIRNLLNSRLRGREIS